MTTTDTTTSRGPAWAVLAALVVALLAAAALGAAGARGAEAQKFSLESFSMKVESNAGAEVTQAGSHPNLTTTFSLSEEEGREPLPVGRPRNVRVELPPGMVGNPLATPRCVMAEVVSGTCPRTDAVGLATIELVTVIEGLVSPFPPLSFLVYNIKPYRNEPAAFAFNVTGQFPVRMDVGVETKGANKVYVEIHDLPSDKPFHLSTVTLWGVPQEHNGVTDK